MANVTTSTVILQPVSTFTGDYPSATNGSNGFTTVTVNYGDNVIIPIRSGSTGSSAGTANYGYSPNGTAGITQGTLSFPGTTYSSSNTTINATVSSVKTDGLISFWCQPSDGGSSVGWRARVQVNVNLDTTISLNSTSISLAAGDTYYENGLTGGGTGTIYYIFNVSNISNGTNLDALRTGGDSRYIARTFTTATSKPFSTDGSLPRITNGLPTSGSSTFYIYAANLNGQNSVKLSNTYTVTAPSAQPPSVSATKEIIPNGFRMSSNPTGTTSGTIQYQWTTIGGGSGPNSGVNASYGWNTASANLGQNAAVGAEWVGTTWSVQARATTDGGASYVYSSYSSVTLPEYTVTAPTSIQEGQSGTFTVTSTNGLGPIYWQVTPTGEFSTSSGQVGSGSASSGTFTVTPTSDGTTENPETATVKLYINNTFDNFNWLRVSDTFTITDPPATPTADTISGVTWSSTNTANSNPTISWSGGSGGTVQVIGSTTNSQPSSSNSYWITDVNGTSPTIITVDSNGNSFVRGAPYYFWVRRSASVVSNSFSSTAPYIALNDTTITISTPTDKNGTQLNLVSGVYEIPQSYGTTSADIINIPFSNGGTYAQYRVLNDTTNQWVSTASVGGSGTFELVPTESGDLPSTGSTYVYSFSGRRPPITGGDGIWQTVNSGATISIKRVSADTQPDAFNLGGPVTVVTGVTANSNTITIGGMDTGASASYSITNTSYSRVSKNGGTFSTSSGTVVNGDTLQVQVDASTTSGVTRSTTLSVGSPATSDSFSVTSTTGGGGGGTSGGGGTGSYGLRVNDTDGSTFIMGSAERFSSVLALQSISLSTSGTASTSISASMGGVSTSNSTVMFLGTPPISSDLLSSIVTYTSSGITINITNSGIGVLNATVLFVRW